MKKPLLKPWEHPNILTWERRQGSVVMASILLSSSTPCATATVIVNGQKKHAFFPDLLQAQAWCDAILQPEKTEQPPEMDPMEKLIGWLRGDPNAMWYVATQVPVLSPWVMLREGWWQRSTPCGFDVAIVRGPPVSQDWSWGIFAPSHRIIDELDFASGLGNLEDARHACDRHLRDLGWLLAS